MPASSTILANFEQVRQFVDVLFAKWHLDGLYYQVKWKQFDEIRGCLVEFTDGTGTWLKPKDLHIGFVSELEGIDDKFVLCCICNDGKDQAPNNIIMCDTCNQGFHIQCPKPHVPTEAVTLDEWHCDTCLYMDRQPKQAPDKVPQLNGKTHNATPKRPRQTPNKVAIPPRQTPVRAIKQTAGKADKISRRSSSKVDKTQPIRELDGVLEKVDDDLVEVTQVLSETDIDIRTKDFCELITRKSKKRAVAPAS